MTFTCAAAGFFVFACSAPEIQADAARFCQTAAPITYSAKDTPETRRQIRVHNAKGVAACGWGKR
ncbi:hypothetical protein [Methylobacterium aquaticum]|uniref:hypothetical protein n=1 Tax=Methylobacterium aquaticum TaxID=270351 RepID=UPI0019331F72|nr:hypothetical protein [Methylobacterium aquaticum]QRE77334.1 hypothetical protein F1D61_30825 [Methylobacterium aquaticum]